MKIFVITSAFEGSCEEHGPFIIQKYWKGGRCPMIGEYSIKIGADSCQYGEFDCDFKEKVL